MFVEGAKVGDMYKYVITTSSGEKLYKADPYANQSQLRPDNASIVADLTGFKWTDAQWQAEKYQQAVNRAREKAERQRRADMDAARKGGSA